MTVAGFFSRYLNGPLPFVRRHIYCFGIVVFFVMVVEVTHDLFIELFVFSANNITRYLTRNGRQIVNI